MHVASSSARASSARAARRPASVASRAAMAGRPWARSSRSRCGSAVSSPASMARSVAASGFASSLRFAASSSSLSACRGDQRSTLPRDAARRARSRRRDASRLAPRAAASSRSASRSRSALARSLAMSSPLAISHSTSSRARSSCALTRSSSRETWKHRRETVPKTLRRRPANGADARQAALEGAEARRVVVQLALDGRHLRSQARERERDAALDVLERRAIPRALRRRRLLLPPGPPPPAPARPRRQALVVVDADRGRDGDAARVADAGRVGRRPGLEQRAVDVDGRRDALVVDARRDAGEAVAVAAAVRRVRAERLAGDRGEEEARRRAPQHVVGLLARELLGHLERPRRRVVEDDDERHVDAHERRAAAGGHGGLRGAGLGRGRGVCPSSRAGSVPAAGDQPRMRRNWRQRPAPNDEDDVPVGRAPLGQLRRAVQ